MCLVTVFQNFPLIYIECLIIFCPSYCNFLVLEEYVSYIKYILHYTETDGTRIEANHVYLLILL